MIIHPHRTLILDESCCFSKTECGFSDPQICELHLQIHPYMHDLNHLKERTDEVTITVNEVTLSIVWTELENKLDNCRVSDDAHNVIY